MKKIIIVLCCLLVAIVPIFTVNNISNSYAYVPGSPRGDLYFYFNVPLSQPDVVDWDDQSNGYWLGYPSGSSSYYPLSNFILNFDSSYYVAFQSFQYSKVYNNQYDFYDVYISLYFRALDTQYGSPDNYSGPVTIEYIRLHYSPVQFDVYATSNYFYYIVGGVEDLEDYKFTLYGNSSGYEFLTFYNSLNTEQKGIVDVFVKWQPLLDSPVCTLDFATIDWQPVESATSYLIYKDNEYYITVADSQFVTVVNGSYYVVAVDSTGTYANSSYSNIINVTAYNDTDGNGFNFFSLFSAIIDANLHLFRSMLDWNILGINLLTLFKVILTIFLIVLLIKFILGRK